MAKNSIRDFSATAGSNTDIQSVNIDENCPASGINNAIRELMVDLKNVSTGAVNLETPAADSLTVAGDLTVDTNTLKVDSSNNRVGIGTASPGNKTEIFHGTAGTGNGSNNALALRFDATTLYAQHYMDSSGRYNIHADAQGVAGGNIIMSADNALFFHTGSTPTERMTIDSSGNVGIGTSSPNNNSGRTTLTIDNASQGGAIDLEHNGTVVGKFICDGANTLGIQADGNRDVMFKTNGSSRMLIDGSGNTRFNCTSSLISSSEKYSFQGGGGFNTEGGNTDANLYLWNRTNSGTNNNIMFFYGTAGNNVGSVKTNSIATAFNTSSDYRLKENVTDMTGAIDRVKALAPKRFNFIVNPDTTVDGFLAHEAQTVVPEAVDGTHNEVDDDGNPVMQGIDQSKLVPLLTGALKEAIAKIETLETEITALKARVTALEA